MTATPTPVGKSAADVDPRLKPADEIEEREREQTAHLDRPVTAPGGTTPVGAAAADQAGFPGRSPETAAASAPPPAAAPPTDTRSAGTPPGTLAEAATTDPRQRIGNLAILARQAIGNQWSTMEVNPQNIADVCQLADAALTANEAAAEENARLNTELDMLRAEMRSMKTEDPRADGGDGDTDAAPPETETAPASTPDAAPAAEGSDATPEPDADSGEETSPEPGDAAPEEGSTESSGLNPNP